MLTDAALRGRPVLSRDGLKLGEITNIEIDPSTFRIATLGVHISRDVADRIGLPHGFFHGPSVQVPVEQVQSIGDAVILAVDAAGLPSLDRSATH